MTVLTVVFEVSGASAEAATRLAEEWAAGRLGVDGVLRPIRVEVTASPAPARPRRGRRPRNEIARLRRAAGLTQAGVALRAGVRSSMVSAAEHGKLQPSAPSYRAIMRVLREALDPAGVEPRSARGTARPRRGDRAVPKPPRPGTARGGADAPGRRS